MEDYSLSLRQVAPEDWPAFCNGFDDLTYEQTLTYAQAAAGRIGADVEFFGLHDAQGVPVAAACFRIKRVPLLNRGIVWIAAGPMTMPGTDAAPNPEMQRAVFAALRSYAQESGHILRLRLPAATAHDPNQLDAVAQEAGFQPTDRSAPYRTVIVDCEQDEDALMRGLHGKWRNHLRKSLKAGLDLDIVPISQAADRFQALYDKVRAAKGFEVADIPPEFYYALKGTDFLHEVLFAQKDGADIAAMTIGRAGRSAVYLFGATTKAGRRPNAGHFLMWESILYCRKMRVKWYDLDGIDPEVNPTVTEFKQRTGGTDLMAAGPYEFRPPTATSALISAAEAVHTRLKKTRA